MSEPVIRVENVAKTYEIWASPRARMSGSLYETLHHFPLFPRWVRDGFGNRYNRCFREFNALKDFSMTVKRGETVGIIGKNGSGKSTLLQIIAGVLYPTKGTVEVKGRVAALLELGSGFNPEFTGRENVYLNASILGMSRKEIDLNFDQIVAFSEIEEFIDQPVKTYSSGMMIRLAFSVQTALNPDVLIVDEALSVGDEPFQRKCFARLNNLRDQGTTILFCSHSMSSIVNLCQKAYFLHRGELVMEGEPKYVAGRYQKFCHAPLAAADRLLQEYREEQIKEREECVDDQPKKKTNIELKSEDHYDPWLKSKSVVNYDSHGAEIQNVRLLDSRGKLVNILRNQENYRYCYDIVFSDTCRDVSFAMLIKRKDGQVLGGCRCLKKDTFIEKIEAGIRYQVEFEFTCLVTEGYYFLNAGVEGLVDGKRAYLHRILDAFVFRVLPDPDTLVTSTVDFMVKPSYRAIKE